jgi:hypothetical protein
MRRLLFFIMFLGVIGGGFYVYKFRQKELKELVNSVSSYPPAKTPKEAAKLFITAIDARDYEAAASYCTPAYAQILKEGAKEATALGKYIDGLMNKLKGFPETDTPEVRTVLTLLDPFPINTLSIEVNTEGEEKASATFVLNYKNLPAINAQVAMPQRYKVDPDLPMALYRGLGNKVQMVKVKDKDQTYWKLDIVPSPALPQCVKILNQKGDHLGRELRDLSMSVNNDATVRTEFPKNLQETIEKATLK